MILKVLNAAFILFAVFMGLKQGWAMIGNKPEMVTMFSKWHFSHTAITINGVITVLSALLILFPRTFLSPERGDHLFAASAGKN